MSRKRVVRIRAVGPVSGRAAHGSRRKADSRTISNLLGALGNPHRLELLTRLLAGPATYQDLQHVSGLQAGPLYHHIGILRQTGLVGPKTRNQYQLTDLGTRLALVSSAVGRLARARPARRSSRVVKSRQATRRRRPPGRRT